MVNGVLDQIHATVQPVASYDPMVVFSSPKYTVGVDIKSIWKNPHYGCMAREDRIVTAGKHK